MLKTIFGRKMYREVFPGDAKERLDADPGILLLDVRTPEEYASAHIPRSKSLPLDQVESRISKIAADKDTEIIVYCLSGARAASACSQLCAMGYTNVSTMGGIRSWKYELAQGAARK